MCQDRLMKGQKYDNEEENETHHRIGTELLFDIKQHAGVYVRGKCSDCNQLYL